MATNKTIVIDPEKCTGCSQCVDSCPGGALAMVDGKAKLVDPNHCDGLGVCIGECPSDAITFEEIPIDLQVMDTPPQPAPAPKAAPAKSPCGCPSHENKVFDRADTPATPAEKSDAPSELKSWPIMLHLIQPTAPQFQEADVLIAASCTAFSHGGFHPDLLQGRGLVIACPKLDVQEGYLEKLTTLFQMSNPRSVSIARMEVPCCMGLTHLVRQAHAAAGSDVPLSETVIALDGGIKSHSQVAG